MIGSKRKKMSADHFRSGISIVALIGFLLGIADGLSAISANGYIEKGLTNIALARFVDELNGAFFLFVAFGVPAAFCLYLLSRIAPRSFRWIASILFFVALSAAAMRMPLFAGAASEKLSLDFPFFLGAGRAAIVLLACLAAARIFFEAFPLFSTLLRGFTLRLVVGILFLLAAANSAAYINYTKNFPRGANVVLVTAGSIRPDHLEAYGYLRRTSPTFDRLASEGILFTRAFTVSPREHPSLASILTGRSPSTHGVRRVWDPLPPAEVTLAEILSDKGYATGAFVGIPFPEGASGLDQGFDQFVEGQDLTAEARTREAIEWTEERKKRPFLLWVHYPEAAMPYEPPGEDRLFAEGIYRGPYGEVFDYRPTRGCRVFGHRPLGDADRAWAIALYDAEIRSVDRMIGRLVESLEASDKIHDTLILVTGTQGESLGEHGYWFDHGEFLYDPSLHVPMLVRAANLPRQIVSGQVRTIDLLPMVLDVLHLGVAPGVDGRSLMGAVERPEDFRDLPLMAESGVTLLPRQNERRPVEGLAGILTAIRKDGWKLIRTPGETGFGEELYDLEADPGEAIDRSRERPEIRRELSAMIERRAADAPVSSEGEGPPPAWVGRFFDGNGTR
ncbi:MAG: sulfatase [Candidatus Eisenbacteria bacterium]